nr:dehydrodolichyl diphosphate synthase 6-like [Tanacetum cinerariifolium]
MDVKQRNQIYERRYSKQHNLIDGAGHRVGFSSLMSMLRYCYELGVKYVTIYAFSIENFKRSPEEVQSLMDLMEEKIEGLIKEESIVNQYGVRVYFIGNLRLLSKPVRLAAERAMDATAKNSKAVLLICIAYTSTDEISHAVHESCEEKWDEVKVLDDCETKDEKNIIDVADIERHMYMAVAPDPDIIIRTSEQKGTLKKRKITCDTEDVSTYASLHFYQKRGHGRPATVKLYWNSKVPSPMPNFTTLVANGVLCRVVFLRWWRSLSFVQNYNMHGMRKTVNELHAMLKLHKETLPKKDDNPTLHAIRAGRVQKNQENKSHKAGKGSHGKGKGNIDKENYLEHPIPVAPPGQQVSPAALAAHAAWVKGQKEVAVLMLLTMDLEIQRNLAHLGAYDMLHELKAMYSKQAE